MSQAQGTVANEIQVGQIFESMPVTREHYKVGSILFLAFAIEAWEMMIIVFTSGMISQTFNLSPTQVGALIGAIFLGMIPGAYMWGPIADRVGRRRTTIYSFALYGVASLISAFSVSYGMLYLFRFVSGVVLSGVLVTTFPYFEELLPVRARGRLTVYLASGWPVGVLLAVGLTSWLDAAGWRWIIGMSSLAGLWAIVVALYMPESPYWLVGKGLLEEARSAIRRLALGQIPEHMLQQQLVVDSVRLGSFVEIFKKRFLGTTVAQTVVNFAFSWGYWGMTTWLPTLLGKKGLSLPQSLEFVAISALFMFPGYIASSYLTGIFGRKKVMFVFVSIAAIAAFGFANASSVGQLYVWNFILSFFSLGAWGVWDTWLGEVYPTDIRGVGYSWGAGAQRWANTLAPMVIGALLAMNSSFAFTVSVIAVFLVITVIALLFLRETEGSILR